MSALAEARAAVAALPGVKERELDALGPCPLCRRPLLAKGPTFYRVTIEHLCADPRAVERRVGLGRAIGSQALGAIMGPDEDLAKVMTGPRTIGLHEECAARMGHLAVLLEPADG